MKKIFSTVILFITLMTLVSCANTKAVWSNAKKEKITQILVTPDARYVMFLGANYHYVFPDEYGLVKKILQLDHDQLILINEAKSYFKIDGQSNVSAYLSFKTFNSKLSQQQISILRSFNFKPAQGGEYETHQLLMGKSYLADTDHTAYVFWYENHYAIEVFDDSLPTGSTVVKIVRTPFALIKDIFKNLMWVAN